MSSDKQEGSVEQQQDWARSAAPRQGARLDAEFTDRFVHAVLGPDPGGEGAPGRRRRRYRAKLVPDEETGPLVTELFRRFATGRETLTSLCRWLDGRGVRPPRAGEGGALWRRH